MRRFNLALVSFICLMALTIEPIFAQRPMGDDASSLPSSESPAKHEPQNPEQGAKQLTELRQPAIYPADVKLGFLQRMRENLAYLNEIQAALAESDFERAAEIAEYKLGLSSYGPQNTRQFPHTPPPMKQMGDASRRSASKLALVLQEGDMKKSLEALSTTTSTCVACHATFYAQ